MGHVRLGRLPRTREWKEIVGLIDGGAGAAQLASATISAAEEWLVLAGKDQGVIEAIWLLTQIPLAAKEGSFSAGLRDAGLDVGESPGLMEIVGAVADAIDRRLPGNQGRTDLGEMAQMAALETLSEVIGRGLPNLFGPTPEDVRNEFARFTTVKQFSALGKDFFARLTNKCLSYFLSREVAHHVGEGRRFATLAQLSAFSTALDTHCREAARIVERFSGEWFSKTNWEQKGITRKRAASFAHAAMKKLLSELRQGAHPNAE